MFPGTQRFLSTGMTWGGSFAVSAGLPCAASSLVVSPRCAGGRRLGWAVGTLRATRTESLPLPDTRLESVSCLLGSSKGASVTDAAPERPHGGTCRRPPSTRRQTDARSGRGQGAGAFPASFVASVLTCVWSRPRRGSRRLPRVSVTEGRCPAGTAQSSRGEVSASWGVGSGTDSP